MNTDTLAYMTLEELLQSWPEMVVVFQRHQMACPGCALAAFYTVADAAAVYEIDLNKFVQELIDALEVDAP